MASRDGAPWWRNARDVVGWNLELGTLATFQPLAEDPERAANIGVSSDANEEARVSS
ncbi:Hypothetical protein A7982_04095 [Minicystis rosea]|nr:Hypothetical protein A7982_04095 [Minicystis rosea]